MKCSKVLKCKYGHSCKGIKSSRDFSSIVGTALVQIVEDSSLPIHIASKVSTLLNNTLDAADFCDVTFRQEELLPEKIRILDRAIVNKLEQLYEMMCSKLACNNETFSNRDFFSFVPRGECLDILLASMKHYCIGNEELKKQKHSIEILTKKHESQGVINWDDVYETQEYKSLMESMFISFFQHTKKGMTPIPALNIRMDKMYQPQRINKLLSYMHKSSVRRVA